MELTETVKRLDDEVKVIKNEIQAVLLDIRETYLNRENPFNPEVSAPTISSVVAASMMGMGGGGQASAPRKEKPQEEKGEKEEDVTSSKISKTEETSMKNEPTDRSEPEGESMTTEDKIAQEGVKERAWGSELKPALPNVSPNGHNGHNVSNGKINLSIIAEMAQWVNEAVRKLGYDKTETILDVAEIVGHLKPELKTILVKFAKRVPAQEIAESPSTRDYIGLLVKLEGLLGMNSKSDEIGLLSIFCQEV
ncbi:MAG: hypothetical protein PHY28_05655 [Dehalococcoidales bacterium]|nr:hypothetical protein [Dehalococcoidales bacterium]